MTDAERRLTLLRFREQQRIREDDALAGLDVVQEPIALSVAIAIVLVCALITGGLIVWGVLRWGMR